MKSRSPLHCAALMVSLAGANACGTDQRTPEASAAASQMPQAQLPPPGRLVDLGGFRMHLLCTGSSNQGRPTVVLSAGGGDFAVDWSLVQRPLSDSIRVCSYDRPGYGWSDRGPEPRTFWQEAFDLHAALATAGERAPFVLVGHSLGAFVVRAFADTYRAEVIGMVLVGPTNENGKLGYRGQFVLMRTLATDRPIPSPRTFGESPPAKATGADADSCRARAERTARIVRPYDQLRAQAQRYRVWALQHPACGQGQDDLFAEQMARFYDQWRTDPTHSATCLSLSSWVLSELSHPPASPKPTGGATHSALISRSSPGRAASSPTA